MDAMIQLFEERENLVILITPEGTRKYVPRWKTGFYHVAKGANVPIILGYLDYEKKHAGIGPIVYPVMTSTKTWRIFWIFIAELKVDTQNWGLNNPVCSKM